MQPFTRHTGIAVPLIKDDINTDQIAPVQSMRQLKPDYRALLFMRARRRDDGSADPDFVLNKPQFKEPGILVTGHNFGAGSSREAAVWGMLANNIRVIVARSFADIYRENCLQNGLLPIVLAMPDSSGANPAARCAPAATVIAANQENVASPPPTAISNIVRVRKCVHISSARRPRPRPRSPGVLPTCGRSLRGKPECSRSRATPASPSR